MRHGKSSLALVAIAAMVATVAATKAAPDQTVAQKPAALIADGMPAIPLELAARSKPYIDYRRGTFLAWHPNDGSMLIKTRFSNVDQVHQVHTPMGARRQLTYENEPVAGASWSPSGDILVAQKDAGGSENYQIYAVSDGRLTLLSDGESKNAINSWSKDGQYLSYTSTRRNGADSDLYIMNPRDPSTDRLLTNVDGGGWSLVTFFPDDKRALLANFISASNVDLYVLDIQTGKKASLGTNDKDVFYGNDPDHGISFSWADFDKEGQLWVTSNEDSEFMRLGVMDVKTGAFAPRGPGVPWDVEGFDIAPGGDRLAYVYNEAGISRVGLLDLKTSETRAIDTLPDGFVSRLSFSPAGALAVTVSAPKGPADTYVVDPDTLETARWTLSETGGLSTQAYVEPQLHEIQSFDGVTISGFLYRPDPKRFPGDRPLLVDVHGGPEYQSRSRYLGRHNYLINELGIAVFRPNVRGSTGYGRTFVALDDGPFKREDSVRDIGAFLDYLEELPGLDGDRIGLKGASYGGYMCYASAIWYADRLKATNCIVAISNFVTFLENTKSYRRDLRRVEYGDERDPKQRAKLLEISPTARVNEITNPMFIVTGSNDPRVPASEADGIIGAIRANSVEAWHLVGTNEGHGFSKKVNRDYQFWSTILFWQTFLLGSK